MTGSIEEQLKEQLEDARLANGELRKQLKKTKEDLEHYKSFCNSIQKREYKHIRNGQRVWELIEKLGQSHEFLVAECKEMEIHQLQNIATY
jgi:hypothetical protein